MFIKEGSEGSVCFKGGLRVVLRGLVFWYCVFEGNFVSFRGFYIVKIFFGLIIWVIIVCLGFSDLIFVYSFVGWVREFLVLLFLFIGEEFVVLRER